MTHPAHLAARPATLEPVRFGEFLRDRSLITDEQWLAALADHWSLAMQPSAGKRRRIGSHIVEAGFLPAEVVEQEARAFHDDLDVVEIHETAPRSERNTLPVVRVTFSPGRDSF
jgi:hypothetical protein